MKPVLGRGFAFALLILSATVIGLVAESATMSKTLGVPPRPPYTCLPLAGGWPEESLALTGRLAYDKGVYKLDVEALLGYVVTLRFATSNLETYAQAHLWQRITVRGHWDSTNPTVFVVESVIVS